MALADYCSVSDIGNYLPDVDTVAQTTILTSLKNAASRFIDHTTGQWFYNDGGSTKYFSPLSPAGNMEGGPRINTMFPFFSVTAVKLAYFENQPLSQWLTLDGDPDRLYLHAAAIGAEPREALGDPAKHPHEWQQRSEQPNPHRQAR